MQLFTGMATIEHMSMLNRYVYLVRVA